MHYATSSCLKVAGKYPVGFERTQHSLLSCCRDVSTKDMGLKIQQDRDSSFWGLCVLCTAIVSSFSFENKSVVG